MSDTDKKEKAVFDKIMKVLGNSALAINQVAGKMGISPSTAAKYLGRMEAKGLVEMDASEPPRKKYRVLKGNKGE